VVVADPVPAEVLLLGAAAQLSATKLMASTARRAMAFDLTDRCPSPSVGCEGYITDRSGIKK
jgi:hypothetical protein